MQPGGHIHLILTQPYIEKRSELLRLAVMLLLAGGIRHRDILPRRATLGRLRIEVHQCVDFLRHICANAQAQFTSFFHTQWIIMSPHAGGKCLRQATGSFSVIMGTEKSSNGLLNLADRLARDVSHDQRLVIHLVDVFLLDRFENRRCRSSGCL